MSDAAGCITDDTIVEGEELTWQIEASTVD